MSKHNNNKQNSEAERGADYFHGAALVTADGREIPITETMVQQALTTLAQQDPALMPNDISSAHRVR